jgi:prefoldin subunit 5|tara:strand:+ start:501 stop:695 length:195 start_codon:yes stop_codon:yes gene_type:complete
MSKEIKELKEEVKNLKQIIKRLEVEIDEICNSNVTIHSLNKDMKIIKQELMKYSEGKLYFENAW